MPSKTIHAHAVGITIWLFGMLAIMAFSATDWFPAIPIPIAFLTAPLMIVPTHWHLRDVARAERYITAIHFGSLHFTISGEVISNSLMRRAISSGIAAFFPSR